MHISLCSIIFLNLVVDKFLFLFGTTIELFFILSYFSRSCKLFFFNPSKVSSQRYRNVFRIKLRFANYTGIIIMWFLTYLSSRCLLTVKYLRYCKYSFLILLLVHFSCKTFRICYSHLYLFYVFFLHIFSSFSFILCASHIISCIYSFCNSLKIKS